LVLQTSPKTVRLWKGLRRLLGGTGGRLVVASYRKTEGR
jgi:hypothetical protein